ncbi:MAG TPA: glycosyltransferase family 2 protein [Patescibacteria group bacterium]|nr:glycosyltransferase family 2 protein [Patescibacteria group bacterium]
MAKLSVVLATYNEEKNLDACLASVKDIVDEIIIVDGSSLDGTVAIAEKYNAKITIVPNQQNFHINKQKALDIATHPWILQLDADERVSKQLASEIQKVIGMSDEEINTYQKQLHQRKLFLRHQALIEKRDGIIGKRDGFYAAFFVPRLNYFLGKNLRYGGVYPDGVIRLVKKGFAHFPAKDVHEQIAVDGRVGWLQHDLIHMADPTFKRYLERNSRYIDFIVTQLQNDHVGRDSVTFLKYMIGLPVSWFFLTFIRHKGFLDGWQGFVFSLFSALRFPRAYSSFLWKK